MSSVSGLLEELFPPRNPSLDDLLPGIWFQNQFKQNISSYALELCLIDQGEI